jgi:hypothetical protein
MTKKIQFVTTMKLVLSAEKTIMQVGCHYCVKIQNNYYLCAYYTMSSYFTIRQKQTKIYPFFYLSLQYIQSSANHNVKHMINVNRLCTVCVKSYFYLLYRYSCCQC